jgi:hypothetical protein
LEETESGGKREQHEPATSRSGLAAGVTLLLGPLQTFVRSLLGHRNDTSDTMMMNDRHHIVPQPSDIAQEASTRIAQIGAHQSAATESSRQMTTAFCYVPKNAGAAGANEISRQVMRQAMIQAARSAGASAKHGAAVLSGTATSVTTVAATTSKLMFVAVALFLSLLAAGGAVGLVWGPKHSEAKIEKEPLGGGGNENGIAGIGNETNITIAWGGGSGGTTGGGSGGGSGGGNASGNPIRDGICKFGHVLGEENLCLPAKDVCGPWQIAENDECTACADGQVAIVNENSGAISSSALSNVECEPCPPGMVRSSANGTGMGPCVAAGLFCELWQVAYNGTCVNCDTGQVSAVNETLSGPTFLSCDFCPPGYVRSSPDGEALGICVLANKFCNEWQHAETGKCDDCTTGQVSAIDVNGYPIFDGCRYCDPGKVRTNAGGDALGPCVPAMGFCSEFEAALQGRCQACPTGSASSIELDGTPNHKSCEFCPRGQVRSSADGTALGPCVSAAGYCYIWQMAEFGRCNACPRGQISLSDLEGKPTYEGCKYCPLGQVRVDADGRLEGACVSAVGICTSAQRAIKGQCVNCIDGQVASSNPDGTLNHQSCVNPLSA